MTITKYKTNRTYKQFQNEVWKVGEKIKEEKEKPMPKEEKKIETKIVEPEKPKPKEEIKKEEKQLKTLPEWKKKIQDYYKPNVSESGIFYLNIGGNKNYILDSKEYILSFGENIKTKQDALKNPNCMVTQGSDLKNMFSKEISKIKSEAEHEELASTSFNKDKDGMITIDQQIPREFWNRISQYMKRGYDYDPIEDKEILYWYIEPGMEDKVAQELGAGSAQDCLDRGTKDREETDAILKKLAQKKKLKKETKSNLRNLARDGEYRITSDGSQINLIGKEIQIDDEYAHAGVGMYVVYPDNEPDKAVIVELNGADGADWSRNNIKTGGAGAVGVWVPRDKTDEIIKKFKEVQL